LGYYPAKLYGTCMTTPSIESARCIPQITPYILRNLGGQSNVSFFCTYLSLCLEIMPLYEVEYSIPLTKAHKDDLAAAITKIHHLAYGIPSFFISVKLTDGSKNENYSGVAL
jgi:phenylpyruvate tautomerase PptA (4-oxalocrotonate tautomerase family)